MGKLPSLETETERASQGLTASRHRDEALWEYSGKHFTRAPGRSHEQEFHHWATLGRGDLCKLMHGCRRCRWGLLLMSLDQIPSPSSFTMPGLSLLWSARLCPDGFSCSDSSAISSLRRQDTGCVVAAVVVLHCVHKMKRQSSGLSSSVGRAHWLTAKTWKTVDVTDMTSNCGSQMALHSSGLVVFLVPLILGCHVVRHLKKPQGEEMRPSFLNRERPFSQTPWDQVQTPSHGPVKPEMTCPSYSTTTLSHSEPLSRSAPEFLTCRSYNKCLLFKPLLGVIC